MSKFFGFHISASLNDASREALLGEQKTIINEGLSDHARELAVHGENDHTLYKTSYEPIKKNLAKKKAKGTYDSEKAKKLWGYHADRIAQSYHKNYGDKHTPWHHAHPTSVRKELAAHLEKTEHLEEATDHEKALKDYQNSDSFKKRIEADKKKPFNGKKAIKENLKAIAGILINEVSNEAPNIQRLTLTQEEPAYKRKLRESEAFVAEAKKMVKVSTEKPIEYVVKDHKGTVLKKSDGWKEPIKEAKESIYDWAKKKKKGPWGTKKPKAVNEEPDDKADSKKKPVEKVDPVQNKKDKISKAVSGKTKVKPVGDEGNEKPVVKPDGTKDYDDVNDDPIKGDKTMTGSPKDKIVLNPHLGLGNNSGSSSVQSGTIGMNVTSAR